MRPRRGQCGAALSAGRPDRGDPHRALGEWMRVSPRLGMGSRARSALGLASGRWAGGSGMVGRNAGPWVRPPEACVEVSEPQGSPGSYGRRGLGRPQGCSVGLSPGDHHPAPVLHGSSVAVCPYLHLSCFYFFFYYLMKTVCFHLGDQTLHRAD